MASRRSTLVLGGGLAGLAAARGLEAHGHSCVLLERCPTLGGLTRTVEVDEFCFDYTGHFLHLAHYGSPAEVPFAGQRNDDWQRVTRRSSCFVAGAYVTAPIQYHLAELPGEERERCARSYEARRAHGEAASFRDYVVSGFGERLAEIFLIPQNEKTMAISLERLSPAAVRRFFPPPDDALIRRGLQADAAPGGYNAQFWYPRSGGIGRLVHGLAEGVSNARVNQQVVSLDLGARTLRNAAGDELKWDALISSIPLKQLCEITGDRELQVAAGSLSHSSTISFNIGLRGELAPALRGLHWVYVPDRRLPFYRVGSYSEISRGTAAQGHSSLYVEVGVPSADLARLDVIGELQPRVIAALEELGWLDRRCIEALVVNVIECAYVHHTAQRDAAVAQIVRRLDEHDIVPIGRYGQWDYTSMEDSIRSGIAAADRVASSASPSDRPGSP